MARTSAAALAAPNVVAFPNAAARKVDNYRYADQRRAVLAARKDSPLCARYLSPADRKADKLAEDLAGMEQTPALLITSAILGTMTQDQYDRVVDQLTGRRDYIPGRKALAVVKASRMCLGEQMDLYRAFDRQREGG
jgi:hypothetical protein